MKLSKKWLMVIALVMSLTVATAGTLAYLTDRDTEVNVFTFGNVDIELKEDFEQDSALVPGVDIEKKPTIINVGPNDAWVWATIAIPSALDNEDASKKVVLFNYSEDSVGDDKWTWKDAKGEWMVEEKVVYDDVEYNVYTVLYQTALKRGENTEPVITKVYMDDHVDIAPDGQLYYVQNGEAVKLDWNIKDDAKPKIFVSAYAMQTTEFDSVQAAYDAYTAQWTESNNAVDAIEWGNDDGLTDGGFIPSTDFEVNEQGKKEAYDDENSKAIFEMLEEGKDVVIGKDSDLVGFAEKELDAKGATVVLNGTGPEAYGYLAFIPDAREDVKLSNLNVTGSGFVEVGHYGIGGGNYTIENVTIENLASTLNNGDKGFNLGCAFMACGDAVLNNCKMTGATAIQDGVMPVDLACGQAWKGYTDDDDNMVSTTINGGEYGTVYCWSHSLVTINGAEIDKLYASPIKGNITIKTGSNIDTINVDYGTSDSSVTKAYLEKLVVEDGANVKKIVFRNTSYTTSEWKEFVNSFVK